MPEWTDTGIVLSTRPHGENNAVVNLLSAEHGRYAGFVYGASSRAQKGNLQLGNRVQAQWRARLSDQLGNFQIELEKNPSSLFLDDPIKLAGLASICAILEIALPERDPQPHLWQTSQSLIEILALATSSESWLSFYVRWELNLLEVMGFGLSLNHCAVSGRTDNLVYVSPKTGNAIHQDYAGDYHNRLLALPAIFRTNEGGEEAGLPTPYDLQQGLKLTGHFLARRIFSIVDKELPQARLRLAHLVSRLYKNI